MKVKDEDRIMIGEIISNGIEDHADDLENGQRIESVELTFAIGDFAVNAEISKYDLSLKETKAPPSRYGNGSLDITISGMPGAGKSHLAKWLGKILHDHGMKVIIDDCGQALNPSAQVELDRVKTITITTGIE